uniref:Ig-like domain-containing protein n=1 Tax=Chelonoidis abingdonii TaxID=106734 RepID=A0A8C0QJB3_CHEAB
MWPTDYSLPTSVLDSSCRACAACFSPCTQESCTAVPGKKRHLKNKLPGSIISQRPTKGTSSVGGLFWLDLTVSFSSVFPAAGSSGEESGPMRLNRIWGESVTFSPVVPTGTWVTNIVWNAKTIIAIVVPGKQASLTVIDQSYTERLRVSDGSHSLEITHLSQEDTGTYTAQITIQGMTKPILQRFALHMYTTVCLNFPSDSVLTVNGMCNVTLHCTLQGGGEDVSYTWNQIAESTVVSSEGSIFISHRLRSGVSPVTCTARNPVSSSSKSISLQEFCEGDILQQQVLLAIILAVCVISDGSDFSGSAPSSSPPCSLGNPAACSPVSPTPPAPSLRWVLHL